MSNSLKVIKFLFVFINFIKYSNTTEKHKLLYSKSVADLQFLQSFEFNIVRGLTEGGAETDTSHEYLDIMRMVELYLIDFYDCNGQTSSEGPFPPANSLCTYRFLRRVTTILQDIVSHNHFSKVFSALSKEVNSFLELYGWPSHEDLTYTIFAILRTQHYIQDSDIRKFADGWIANIQTNCTLRSVDCYEIAMTALSANQFVSAIEWLDIAQEKTLVDKILDKTIIESSLRQAIDLHNEFLEEGVPNMFTFDSQIPHDLQNRKKVPKARNQMFHTFKGKKDYQYSHLNYWGLCSGKTLQSPTEQSYLFCWYEFKIHPSFIIGPIKMEFLARNPDVVQMYEVIQHHQIDTIISEGLSTMYESGVLNLDLENPSNEHDTAPNAEHRASLSGLYNDVENTAISKKFERLTGLNLRQMKVEELLQVASYPPGGHYFPHFDPLNSTKELGQGGDRIATLLFYFKNVELGGSTAFTSAGIAAQPIKGSAVFWYNLYTDGEIDYGSYHGACPVLLGEKWVAQKWILNNDQFLVRKCSLKPKERFKIAVNNKHLPYRNKFCWEMESVPLLSNQSESTSSKEFLKYSYVSPVGLKSLAQMEWNIYREVKRLYQNYRNRSQVQTHEDKNVIEHVKIYLRYFEQTTLKIQGLDKVNSKPARFVEMSWWNPLASYHMIARFLGIIQPWINNRNDSVESPMMSSLRDYLSRVYNISDGPTPKDFHAAMFAIINIQFLYSLPVKDIAEGFIGGVYTGIVLTASDCLRIGKHAVAQTYFTTGIEWLEHVLYLIVNTPDSKLNYDDAHEELIEAWMRHDLELTVSKGYEPHFYDKPINEVPEHDRRNTIKAQQYNAFKGKRESNFVDINFWGICEGKSHQATQETSKLFCWYERNIHPSFQINPVKAELLSMLPNVEVVQYHDIITDGDMDSLQSFTSGNYKQGSPVTIRTSFSFGLDQEIYGLALEKNSVVAMKMSKLTERITGLKVVGKSGGDLQLTGFSPGTYFAPRKDTDSAFKGNNQYRIATFMFYFSDVEKGGDVAFVQAGVKVKPKKGSAIFWYNLLPSGRKNQYSWHGACPVIFGEKWVATNWINYQMQHHLQCGATPQSAFEILVNGKSKY